MRRASCCSLVLLEITLSLSLCQLTKSRPLSKVRVGFIGPPARIPHAKVILGLCEKQLKADGVVPENISFQYVFEEGCDVEVEMLLTATDMFKGQNADVLIGPECTAGMSIAALAASAYHRPVFGYGSVSDVFADKTKYTTLVRTWQSMGSLGSAVKTLLTYFNWYNVAVIRSSAKECDIGLSGIMTELSNTSSLIDVRTVIVVNSALELDDALDTVKSVSRIIIVCFGWGPQTANDFLLAVSSKKMGTSDYVYIIPHFIKLSIDDPRPWKNASINQADRNKLLEMYRNVLVVTATGDDADTVAQFRQYMQENNASFDYASAKSAGFALVLLQETSLPVIFDTFYLYGLALNKTIYRGANISSGVDISESCQYVTLIGKSGRIIMDKQSDRVGEYVVRSMDGNMSYTPLLKIPAIVSKENGTITRDVEPLRPESFSTPDGKHPSDTPACGFTMEVCLKDYLRFIIGVACSVFITAIVALCLLGYYRRWKFEQSLIKMSWKLKFHEIKLFADQPRPTSALWDSRSKRGTNTSSIVTLSMFPEADMFTAFASVRGMVAYAKCYKRRKLPILNREQLLISKRIRELHHENVNSFLGAVIDDGPLVIACWRYAAKGSLLDVIMNDDIHLDDTFVASILKDVVSGLHYLHRSSVHYHGSLRITNCVVDSRWIVKLTDFGWAQFQEHLKSSDVLVINSETKPQRLYHCAPEILRRAFHSNIPNYYASMRAADIYSFAFIIYHVIYRLEPLYDDTISPEEIIDRIKKPVGDPLRPHLPELSDANPKLVALMHRCWQEDPRQRPTVADVKTSFECIFQQSLKGSLLDHMMTILEKYATNLEKVVEERTQQLECERRRCDQLLYQMLPKSVADMLKTGLAVQPESYESVTIYFSDIVGFTALSSESTPMEVVTMLNKLYSEFDETLLLYDVYKVETIGDAYMVVSGMPHRNGYKHVTEICDMALSILDVTKKFKIPHKPDHQLRVRIGIHTGSVAAGVVGQTMPRFCLFGDTVNTASRMESSGEPCKLHISESTQLHLREYPEYVIELRGKISLKGKGLVTTYWLMEKRQNGHSRSSHESSQRVLIPLPSTEED